MSPARKDDAPPRPRSAAAWLYDDLLAWLCPGGLLLTALVLRHPGGLHALREQAPELVLPTWLAGAYVLGLALSPLGELASRRPAGSDSDDGCLASCVDWYGNARPIFVGPRVFALLGYELVEGREHSGRIVEQQRVDFTPRTAVAR